MAIPVASAYISSSVGWTKSVSFPYTDLNPTKMIYLSASATNTPIGWEWSCIPTATGNVGGYPSGSTIWTGIKSDFTNGVATIETPSCSLDFVGGYKFNLRARNVDGWSSPIVDLTQSQAIAYILTTGSLKIPPENHYNYAWDLNESLNTIDNRKPDTKKPLLSYDTAATIYMIPPRGISSDTIRLTFQDNIQRVCTSSLSWSFGAAADLGLDTGAEASGKWYYMYAVPKSGSTGTFSTTEFTYRASETPPTASTIGPTGYTNYVYVGAFWNDTGSSILPFFQYNNQFRYANAFQIDSSVVLDGAITAYALASYIPETAMEATMYTNFQSTAAGYGTLYFWITGYTVGTEIIRSGIGYYWGIASGEFDIATPGPIKRVYRQKTGNVNYNWYTCRVSGWKDAYI